MGHLPGGTDLQGHGRSQGHGPGNGLGQNFENLKGNTGRLQTRYRDKDYEKWAQTVRGVQRKETIREKVKKPISNSNSERSVRAKVEPQRYEVVPRYHGRYESFIPFKELQESECSI